MSKVIKLTIVAIDDRHHGPTDPQQMLVNTAAIKLVRYWGKDTSRVELLGPGTGCLEVKGTPAEIYALINKTEGKVKV